MTEKETKELLLIVQSTYQSMRIDDLLVKEWYGYVKDCYKEDVYNKYKEHIVGDYKDKIPNIAYMTKYLKKKTASSEIYVKCQLCGMTLDNRDYEEHYSREASTNYIEKQALKYFDKQIDRQKYLTMNQNDFDERYTKLLMEIQDKVSKEEFYGMSEYQSIKKALWH